MWSGRTPAAAVSLVWVLALIPAFAVSAPGSGSPSAAPIFTLIEGSTSSAAQPNAEPTLKGDAETTTADPDPEGPTLANAQWIGFTPAVYGSGSSKPGLWIAGPFDRRERIGWVTDTATGATTQVAFVWRDAAPGSQALLSAEAARALGLAPGDVANIAVYLPR
ncbi:MAG: hypothetical protein AAF503_04635 [Pseudomonadota bacterium]